MRKLTTAIGVLAILIQPVSAHAQQDPQLIGEGAQVYSSNCARCHNARSSTERTDAQWAAIVAHMRARGNLTKSQAAAVLAYLQATNLPEGGSGTAMLPTADETDTAVISPREAPSAPRARSAAASERDSLNPPPPGR